MATGSGSRSSRVARPARARKGAAPKSSRKRASASQGEASRPAPAAASASGGRPEPVHPGADGLPGGAATPPSMQDWMKMWQGMADDLSKMGGSGQLPAVSVDANSMLDLQRDYMQRLTQLWGRFVEQPEQAAQPIKDSRFADPSWQSNPIASFYARAYLLNSEFMNKLADSVKADRKTKNRVKFAVSQLVDAAAPSNFLAFNPRAQKTLLDTKGESLKSGLQNLLADMQRGKITMTDENAFEVGKNVATTEGAVVYETQLMQLIQYKPLTAKVHARPFLFVPPAINKFYILDLQPENSMIRYVIEQGHTVFVLSWKNPQQSEAAITWDDYLELGPIAAIHAVQEITGAKDLNVLGFCVGGTILTAALAVLHARGEKPAASLTLMTALLDFEDTGVLDVFIDENHVRMREKSLGKGGLMSGRDLNNTFSSLRPNDLVWNYVVSNYLEGKQPPAFDLLYWNGDSTNLPGPMYAWYLRNCYLENNLRVPNKVKSCGVPLNIGLVNVPAYVFAAKEDHIVPWKAGYASARVLPGTDGKGKDVRYVLGASGHIAGSINPVSKNKRCYWAQPADTKSGGLPADSDAWLAGTIENPGSWWSDWSKWLGQFGGPMKSAPKGYGSARYKVIEPAPGRYVKEKA